MMFPEQPIPDHVPPELVSQDFPFIFGMTTTEDPFDDLAMQVHEMKVEAWIHVKKVAGSTQYWRASRQG